jgi:DnaK suppressor protein
MATTKAAAKTKASPWQPFEDALRLKQRELIDSYERDKAAGNQQPDDGIQDLADKAASAYSKELNLSLSDGERNLLLSIDEAFVRLRDGNYGVCTNCSQDIGFERLRANPGAERCIRCQTQFEKTHGTAVRTTL